LLKWNRGRSLIFWTFPKDRWQRLFVPIVVMAAAFTSTPGYSTTVIHVPGDAVTLDQAISMVPDGGIVELAAGTYSGGFAYNNLGKAFTIRALVAESVVLDGAGIQPVFQLHNSTPSAGGSIVFQNLVIRNGRSTSDGIAGGVTLSRADATFIDCSFENNSSLAPTTGGGGVAVVTASAAHFLRCVWQGNVAKNEAGGLRVSTDSIAVIHSSQFNNNSVSLPNHRNTAAGGGIHVGDATLRITNTRLSANDAGYVGGGLYAIGTWQDPVEVPRTEVLVANCTFIDNRAEADDSVTTPSPPEAGGLHVENQTIARVFNSRFVTNTAEKGGGANSYRARLEIHDSVFRGNWVDGRDASTGFGAAVAVASADSAVDGSTNRPNGTLVITNTLIQGRYGSVTTVAQTAGGAYVAGDKNREYGFAGVAEMGPTSANRSSVVLQNVVFSDCDVTETPQGGKGLGGGLSVELGDLTVTDSLFIDSDAIGSESTGGALRFVIDSVGSIFGSGFANSSAEQFGGAIFAQGSQLDLDQCVFLENAFSPGTAETAWQSFGAAIFSGPIVSFGGSPLPMGGAVEDCVFASNDGLPIFDDDRAAGPINGVVYNRNEIHSAAFGTDVYRDSLVSPQNVSQLNALTVSRNGGVPSTEKSQDNNVALASVPSIAVLNAVPSKVLPVGAAGDGDGSTEAFVAWAWSGSTATLNGSPLAATTGTRSASTGISALDVDGVQAQVFVTAAPESAIVLSATPLVISSGEAATLQWTLTAGTYLDVDLDSGVRLTPGEKGASGSVAVSPNVTTTYRIFATTEEGGAFSETTVWVGEPSVGLVFADGVESGDTSAWSSSVGSTQ